MINVDEKSIKNVKIKKIIKKKFLKKKENLDTTMFEIVDMKNLNAKILIKYYINNTITISSNFTKFFFEFENFSKEENATQTHEKEQKRIRKRMRTKVSKRRTRRNQISKFLFFI